MTLLHSFRIALVDGDILDGIGRSIVVNLRSHIRKEDEEFFMLIDRYLDADKRKHILECMKKVEESFEPIKPVSRQEARKMSTKKERNKHDDDAFAAREARQADAGSGGGGCPREKKKPRGPAPPRRHRLTHIQLPGTRLYRVPGFFVRKVLQPGQPPGSLAPGLRPTGLFKRFSSGRGFSGQDSGGEVYRERGYMGMCR